MFGYAMNPIFANLVYHFLQDIKSIHEVSAKKQKNLNLPSSFTMGMPMESKRKL
jgi:hypothetical protein